MHDTTPQTADEKVLWHFAMSLDGFVVGPDHAMDWMEGFSPTIGRQLLALGLIDEIDLPVVPVLLGQGIRLYDNRGGQPVRLERVGADGPAAAVNVR